MHYGYRRVLIGREGKNRGSLDALARLQIGIETKRPVHVADFELLTTQNAVLQCIARVVRPVFARLAAVPTFQSIAANRQRSRALALRQNALVMVKNQTVAFVMPADFPMAEMIKSAVTPFVRNVLDANLAS